MNEEGEGRWFSHVFQDGIPVFLHTAGYIKSVRLIWGYLGVVNAINAWNSLDLMEQYVFWGWGGMFCYRGQLNWLFQWAESP